MEPEKVIFRKPMSPTENMQAHLKVLPLIHELGVIAEKVGRLPDPTTAEYELERKLIATDYTAVKMKMAIILGFKDCDDMDAWIEMEKQKRQP